MSSERDDFDHLTVAAQEVLGSDPTLLQPKVRPGNWCVAGGVLALLAAEVAHLPIWATIVLLFALGWYANDAEAKAIRARLLRQASDEVG